MCIFMGYSESHYGYRCLHMPTNKIYIIHHVVFDEKRFPFAEISSYNIGPINCSRQCFSSLQVMPLDVSTTAVSHPWDQPIRQ